MQSTSPPQAPTKLVSGIVWVAVIFGELFFSRDILKLSKLFSMILKYIFSRVLSRKHNVHMILLLICL